MNLRASALTSLLQLAPNLPPSSPPRATRVDELVLYFYELGQEYSMSDTPPDVSTPWTASLFVVDSPALANKANGSANWAWLLASATIGRPKGQ